MLCRNFSASQCQSQLISHDFQLEIVLLKIANYVMMTSDQFLTLFYISKNSRLRHNAINIASHDHIQSISYIMFDNCALFQLHASRRKVAY